MYYEPAEKKPIHMEGGKRALTSERHKPPTSKGYFT